MWFRGWENINVTMSSFNYGRNHLNTRLPSGCVFPFIVRLLRLIQSYNCIMDAASSKGTHGWEPALMWFVKFMDRHLSLPLMESRLSHI